MFQTSVLKVVGMALLGSALLLAADPPPLVYNESTDYPGGDFPVGTTFPNLGSLGVGLNTISGHVNGTTPLTTGDYRDAFSVTLPAGLLITSAQVVISNYDFGGGAYHHLGDVLDQA